MSYMEKSPSAGSLEEADAIVDDAREARESRSSVRHPDAPVSSDSFILKEQIDRRGLRPVSRRSNARQGGPSRGPART